RGQCTGYERRIRRVLDLRIDAAGREAADIDVGHRDILDFETRVALDEAAEHVVDRGQVNAAVDDGLCDRRVDGTVDLDVPVIDRPAPLRHGFRGYHEAERPGLRLLRLAVRVAADQRAVALRALVAESVRNSQRFAVRPPRGAGVDQVDVARID